MPEAAAGVLLSAGILREADEVIALLRGAGQTIATAESLTAGLCCAALTTVPGSSAVVRGGLIVYATDLKGSLAGVPAAVLARYGPVSRPTAHHLAIGAARQTGSDWGIALTGVAGPSGQDGHAPGTVWVAVHAPQHGTASSTRLLRCVGDRSEIREQAVGGVLALLAEQLREQPGPPVR